MKPNTTRFNIKAPFCHTITASQCFDGGDIEEEEGKQDDDGCGGEVIDDGVDRDGGSKLKVVAVDSTRRCL